MLTKAERIKKYHWIKNQAEMLRKERENKDTSTEDLNKLLLATEHFKTTSDVSIGSLTMEMIRKEARVANGTCGRNHFTRVTIDFWVEAFIALGAHRNFVKAYMGRPANFSEALERILYFLTYKNGKSGDFAIDNTIRTKYAIKNLNESIWEIALIAPEQYIKAPWKEAGVDDDTCDFYFLNFCSYFRDMLEFWASKDFNPENQGEIITRMAAYRYKLIDQIAPSDSADFLIPETADPNRNKPDKYKRGVTFGEKMDRAWEKEFFQIV